MKKLAILFVIFISATSAFANEKEAIEACNNEIMNNFHKSVKIEFPTPAVYENDNFYFVHYKGDRKLIIGNRGTRIDVRCTINKFTNIITLLNIAGKDRTKPYDPSAIKVINK